MTELACELCLGPANTRGLSNGANTLIGCKACGSYAVSGLWRAANMKDTLDELGRTRLRGVVRRATDEHGDLGQVITNGNWQGIAARHDQPNGSLEQMERLLVLLAERSLFYGAKAAVDSWEAMSVRLYLPRAVQSAVGQMLETLEKDGYIRRQIQDTWLTERGWTVAEKARRTARSGNLAFVAMWFHADMDALFDQAFEPALRACGYTPFRVDREQHNNKIDDEIIANIRKSRLFVGDLSGMRPNVFYEAGFAHGLGVPVLLTCNESYAGALVHASPDCSGDVPLAEKKPWFKQVADSAFDIRQYLILPWSTPIELAAKLENRIRALSLALS